MAARYTIEKAGPDDLQGISGVFARLWGSRMADLQCGIVPSDELQQAIMTANEKGISDSNMAYMVARDAASGQVVALAIWTLPHAAQEQRGYYDELRRKDEERNRLLSDRFNVPLIREFRIMLRDIREHAIGPQRHYLLENLATHPEHRGQGLATKLITEMFEDAGRGQHILYLDTARDNKAKALYERLGFTQVGEGTVPVLERFGGSGSHTHVAMIRQATAAE